MIHTDFIYSTKVMLQFTICPSGLQIRNLNQVGFPTRIVKIVKAVTWIGMKTEKRKRIKRNKEMIRYKLTKAKLK